jgi:TM2 domain-containing membrane protein YozV
MGVIYCEQCLAERLKDVHPNVPPPVQGFVSSTPIAPMSSVGPHPAVAGILSGFFPFGVGAVYTGQYAKGLAHLLIFVGLIWGLSSGHMGGFEPVLGIAMGFFVVYQIIDSVRSANAIRLGQAPPDPFGFSRTFGISDPIPATANSADTSAPLPPVAGTRSGKVPTAAVVLIGLGVLFLLQTAGVFEFNVERIWPLFLIGLGVWLFIARTGMLGHGYGGACGPGQAWDGYNPRAYDRRVWSGPIWLITIGGLFLIQGFDGPGFGRTWPVLLLVVGLMKLMGNRTQPIPPAAPLPPPAAPAGFDSGPIPPPENQSSSNEVKNG